MNAENIKRIVAREGLIVLSVIVVGFVLACRGGDFGYMFLVFGYPAYLLMRFVNWAIIILWGQKKSPFFVMGNLLKIAYQFFANRNTMILKPETKINPKKERIEELNNFRGWLLFYYVICWLTTIFCGILSLMMLICLFAENSFFETASYSLYAFLFLIYSLLFFRISKKMKHKSSSIPNYIVNTLIVSSLVMIVGTAVISLIKYFLNGEHEIKLVGQTIFDAFVYLLVWVNYFYRSKRVYSYYGQNASLDFIRNNN